MSDVFDMGVDVGPWHCGLCGNDSEACQCGDPLVLIVRVPGLTPTETDHELIAAQLVAMLNDKRVENYGGEEGYGPAPVRLLGSGWHSDTVPDDSPVVYPIPKRGPKHGACNQPNDSGDTYCARPAGHDPDGKHWGMGGAPVWFEDWFHGPLPNYVQHAVNAGQLELRADGLYELTPAEHDRALLLTQEEWDDLCHMVGHYATTYPSAADWKTGDRRRALAERIIEANQ